MTPDDTDPTGDAIALLIEDHDETRELFAEYEDLLAEGASDDERQALATEICQILTVHAAVEEEIFYPAARTMIDEPELLDEAEADHDSARALIAQIEAMEPADDRYDATVRVLSETVEHHVQEEEGELFPRVQASSLDLETLGEQMESRREDLMAEMGIERG